ncbi:MAG: SDR family NAD(P)-dependent oxidoreductase [Burkholderiaceae bacterium]
MEVIIVTGASKGLGAALVERLLSPDRKVIGIARAANEALAASARSQGAWLDWSLQDLSDLPATDALAASICAGLPRDAKSYTLINNAALADPIGPIAGLDPARVVAAINVNLTAAMLFTSRFLAATAMIDAERRVLNISSGLARRPMDGTSPYCTSKAGLDMFTRCINAEPYDPQRALRKAKASSLAPGVIDTGMQVVMRGQDASTFPEGIRFQAMKEEGKLVSAQDVATKVAAYLQRDDFGSVEIDDIRNY